VYGHIFVCGTHYPRGWWEWKSNSLSDGKAEYMRDAPMWHYSSFELDSDAVYREVTAPHWFLVAMSASIAALPWIKWRFSLRTLLIVMTLFALFFGMIAWSL
jgi:hypothetical protein